MSRTRLVAAIAILVLIAVVSVYLEWFKSKNAQETIEGSGTHQAREEAKAIEANIAWNWRGALNGIVLDVKAWNGKVYLLVKTGDNKLILYLINASTGEFLNKTLISNNVNYASMQVSSEGAFIGIVGGDGEVKVVKYDPESMKISSKTVAGHVDISVVDVMDLVVGEGWLVVAGGIHTEDGLKPVILRISPTGGNWSKVIEDTTGYFMDVAVMEPLGTPICAVASAGALYCFSENGSLIVEKDVEAKITQLLEINGIVAAISHAENEAVSFIALNASNGDMLSVKVLGSGYPLSAQLANGKLVVILQTYSQNKSGNIILVVDISTSEGAIKLDGVKELLIKNDWDASFFKATYYEGRVYLAGRVGVKPFVVAAMDP